jgi:hypothetical protein
MKKTILIILQLISFSFCISAQNNYTIHGMISDTSANGTPICYVSIGIIGKNVGTVSNDSGIFKLSIPTQYLNDSITFSRIGYYSKLMNVGDLIKLKSININLVSKNTELGEVHVVAEGLTAKTIGNITKAKNVVMGISSTTLGKEIGTVIHLPNEPVFLKDFNFYIVGNRPDSAKFRLNIYRYNKEIGENLLKRNIYFSIPGGLLGDYAVDLRKYNIFCANDIFIAVEVIAVYSKGPDPNIKLDKFYYDRINVSGSVVRGSKSFNREVSLGQWEKTKYSFSPGFWITYFN